MYIIKYEILFYLSGITIRSALNGFGPEVYFDIIIGINNFKINISVVNNVKLSLGTPASISFNFAIVSVAANPICKENSKYFQYLLQQINFMYRLLKMLVYTFIYPKS